MPSLVGSAHSDDRKSFFFFFSHTSPVLLDRHIWHWSRNISQRFPFALARQQRPLFPAKSTIVVAMALLNESCNAKRDGWFISDFYAFNYLLKGHGVRYDRRDILIDRLEVSIDNKYYREVSIGPMRSWGQIWAIHICTETPTRLWKKRVLSHNLSLSSRKLFELWFDLQWIASVSMTSGDYEVVSEEKVISCIIKWKRLKNTRFLGLYLRPAIWIRTGNAMAMVIAMPNISARRRN